MKTEKFGSPVKVKASSFKLAREGIIAEHRSPSFKVAREAVFAADHSKHP